MTSNPLAAAVAFFALGVTAFGSALLLLFNPRSRSVRWFVLFQAAIATWLGAQGWGFATGDWSWAGYVVSGAVHLAPGLFLGFAFSEAGKGRWVVAAPLLLGLALLPVDLRSVGRVYAEPLLLAWNLSAWLLATWILARSMRRHVQGSARQRRAARIITALMVGVLPVGIVGGMLSGGSIVVYVMPLLMVWIQALVFIGVARLRFYDIEVRASRTGEIAAAAAEQERLAVVGELAASLAHEIRNPLTGVRSLAQRLAEDEVDEPRRRRYAGVILEEVGRVERLVADLLGVARRAPRGRSAGSDAELEPLFDDLSLLVGARAEKRGVRLEFDAGGTVAAAPREPLAQALLNLLLNALAHAPAGSAVEVRARETAAGVELTVRDHGPGVPAHDRERIWEPFHSGGEGTGLGLAVVRRLVREEGWTVALVDPPGGGAEFRLSVPGRAPNAASTLPRRMAAQTSSLSS